VRNLFAALLLVATACDGSAPSVSIDEQSNGASIPLTVGENLAVTLKSLGDSGFPNWTVTTSPDHAVLKSMAAEHQQATSGLLGDFGKDIFKFQAVAPGQTSLIASAAQPWSGGATVTFTLAIQVR